MHARTIVIRANAGGNLALAGLLLMAACPLLTIAQEDDDSGQTVTPDQRARIESAKTVDKLTELGKQFALQREHAAAGLCIEKICTLDPELLTDDRRPSPKSWKDVWFTHRATLREKKLEPDDAAGRVKLARWLHEAGVSGAARKLLAAALAIDEKLPEARQLAVELQPRLGLDFRYALTHPVRLEEYKDENVTIKPRQGQGFLLAPLYYLVMEKRYSFGATSARVETDTGRRCRVRGILLSRDQRPPAEDDKEDEKAPPGPPQEPPSGFDEILYERIYVDLKDGEPIVEWQNTISSRPRTPPRGADRPRADRSRRDRATPSKRRGEMPASGWAALLIEYPQDAMKLACELLHEQTQTIDLTLLELLQDDAGAARQSRQDPDELAGQVEDVVGYASDASAVTAHLVVAWLADALGGTSSSREDQGSEVTEAIEQALITAMGHASRRVRQAAATGLFQAAHPLTEASQEFLRTHPDATMLSAILTEIESSLASASEVDADESRGPDRWRSDAGDSEALQLAVAGMPRSSAAPNLFSVLSACLDSGHAQIRQQALEIALADGSQQSTEILADLTRPAREALIAGMKDRPDDEAKAAILRVMLIRSDAAAIAKALAACDQLAITVTSENDPLLTALTRQLPGEVLHKLLELLTRADLTAIAGSEQINTILDTLSEEHKEDRACLSAMLELALGQFKPPYEAPIRQEAKRRRTTEPQASGFEPLLAKLAMDANISTEDARAAATALVVAGRLTALEDQFLKCSALARCQDIVRTLGRDKRLWAREALPVFLASCLSHGDPQTVQLALASLAVIDKAADPQHRWRVNLAVKQGLDDDKQLVRLTLHPEDRIAEQAMDLLTRVAMLNPEESHDLKRNSDEGGRGNLLNMMMQERASKPAGQFACMVYVNVESDRTAVGSLPGAGPRRFIRRNIPLPSSKVVIEKAGEESWRITADGEEISISGKDAARPPGRGRRSSPQTVLEIDAAPLLSAALRSEHARKEGLTGKVDLLPISQGRQQTCRLSPELLGTWAGELAVSGSSRRSSSDRPMRITAAKIILEPMSR